jgi:hypothetical protein
MAYTKAPDAQLLQAALVGYEHQRSIVEERTAELRRELAGAPAGSAEGNTPRRGMSAAGRRRIAAAQRKRWAELKKASVMPPVKTKRKISAAARKRIADATRKRWKAYRAAKAAAATK